MLSHVDRYEDLLADFTWNVPTWFNIGTDVCDRWAEQDPDRIALIVIEHDDTRRDVSFGTLRLVSNRLANLFSSHHVRPGDRVGILLPQAMETAAAHIAVYKMGAIAVPLFVLFGPDALEHRIVDAGIKTVITDLSGAKKLRSMALPTHQDLNIFTIDGADKTLATLDAWALMRAQPDDFQPLRTRADDPALIIYTSGTTGAPKGVLHGHRVLLGHLPGMEMSHDFFPKPGDLIWTPADWAWIGGLLDVLLPALHHGVPVVAKRFEKFTGEAAYALLSSLGITNAFLPPTALKMMRATPHHPAQHPLRLRSVGSGGETLGAELLDWGRAILKVTINEFYGQTECNLIVSSCAALMAPRPGIMGRVVPGHEVAVIRDDASRCNQGEAGMIAVRSGDPVMFLSYWNKDQATAEKVRGDWMITGDLGVDEGDGWIRFIGRDDDVITSAGYRIGPGEVENCLIQHEAVQMAAVIGKPDELRTEIVKAYIVLCEGWQADDTLIDDIQYHVKTRLSSHEYPREIEVIDELPLTSTGKIKRRLLRQRAEQDTL